MRILQAVLQEVSNGIYEVKAHVGSLQKDVLLDVPYVSQFARPEHSEPSLRKELEPVSDPYWHESGAESPEQYAKWAFTMCGMASTSMALAYFHEEVTSPVALAEDALRSDVYMREDGELSGMRYREFINWIRRHKLHAQMYTKLSVRGIKYALSHGRLVIVSVNPNIRGYDTAPRSQIGGHLVLVTGYDQKHLFINNPSGFTSTDTQIAHKLPVQEFLQFYAGRGIVLSPLA